MLHNSHSGSLPILTSPALNRHHNNNWYLCYLLAIVLLLLHHSVPGASSIDCFKCVSVNGANPACEDPFHNNFSTTILESPCMAGRKNREGLFPATACLKLSGVYADGHSIMIRACALDSGTLTTDTEIIRMSHCGAFYYNDQYVRGCLQSCDDADGCNSAPSLGHNSASLLLLTLGVTVLSAADLMSRLWCSWTTSQGSSYNGAGRSP